jgi:hypothetical protein
MQREHQSASGQGGESGSIFALRARPVYFNVLALKRSCGLTSALTVASFLAMAGSVALADDATAQGKPVAQPTNEQLIEKLERMEARIRALETELHRKRAADANHGSEARVANTRGKAAKDPVESANAAVTPVEAKNTAPAPGYLGAKETTALDSPPPPNNDLFGVAPSPLPGLKIGAYGELRFGAQQNPAANGQ